MCFWDGFVLLSEKKPWMDKLTVLQRLAAKEPLSARIFKAIADPPTTSLQRLKVAYLLSLLSMFSYVRICLVSLSFMMYWLGKSG